MDHNHCFLIYCKFIKEISNKQSDLFKQLLFQKNFKFFCDKNSVFVYISKKNLLNEIFNIISSKLIRSPNSGSVNIYITNDHISYHYCFGVIIFYIYTNFIFS